MLIKRTSINFQSLYKNRKDNLLFKIITADVVHKRLTLASEVLAKVLYICLLPLSLKNEKNLIVDFIFQMRRRSCHSNTKERIKPFISLG